MRQLFKALGVKVKFSETPRTGIRHHQPNHEVLASLAYPLVVE
jgi:hypothetical protein